MYVELTSIHKTYRMSERVSVPALSGVDLSVGEGEFVALVGASGCGKTTLLSILGLLMWPTEGEYRLAGQDTRVASRREQAALRSNLIGFIFQSYNLLARETAWRNVMFPMTFQSETRSTRKQAALDAPVRERMVTLQFDESSSIVYGWEPVLIGDTTVGRIAGGEYGYNVGAFIAHAFVDSEQAATGTQVDVIRTGVRYCATIVHGPLFDPTSARLKS